MTDDRTTNASEPTKLRILIQAGDNGLAAETKARELAQQYADKLPGSEVQTADPDTGADVVVRDKDGNVVVLIEAKIKSSERVARVRKDLEEIRVRNEEARERISRLRERVAAT